MFIDLNICIIAIFFETDNLPNNKKQKFYQLESIISIT